MNLFDGLCLFLVGLLTFLGFFRGLFSQMAGLLALMVAIFASKAIAPPLVALAAGSDVLSEVHTYYLVRIFCGGMLYLLFNAMIGFVDRRLRQAGLKQSSFNRMGGMLFGFIKGSAIVAVVFFALSFIHPDKLREKMPLVEEAKAMQLARRYNPIPHDLVIKNLKRLLLQASNPKEIDKLKTVLQAEGLDAEKLLPQLEQERVLALLEDASFLKFLAGSDIETNKKPAKK